MHNQIFTVRPYLWEGVWVFDDPAVGLIREALVSGMPEMIRMATAEAGISQPENGFVALFSKDPFPGATTELTWVREESSGNTYEWRGQEGWLCPALFRYFNETPKKLYIEVRPTEAQQDFEEWFAHRMKQAAPQMNTLLGSFAVQRATAIQSWLRSLTWDAWQSGKQSGSMR